MKRYLILASLIAALAILAACGGGATPAPQPTAAPAQPTAVPAQPTAAPAQPTAAPAQPTAAAAQPTTAPSTSDTSAGASAEGATAAGLTALADAYGGALKGKTVTMTGPFTDEDAVKFASSVKAFEDATGIDIQYEGSKEFEASIAARIAANDAPDIIDFPQPGFLAGFVKQGKIVDASTLVPEAWLKQNYLQSWLDMATMAGPNGEVQGGVWHRFNGKSLVWYPKKQFDAAGYKVPTTWAELEALQDQIVADGDTPWCIGIESGAATGWPATDWTEDMMLRTTSPENYDKWVRGELKFDSPEVRKAIDTFAKIWQNDKMVNGGHAKIVTTFFGDAPTPMFENPPKCWLHRQGNFITSFFPKEAVAGVDYDVFYLPGIDEAQGKPFLVAGDLMAATNDRPETAAVMQFFSTGEGVKGWLAAGGALAPQKDASLDWYGVPLERSIAEIANNATTVRFDASDLMPGAVGAGSFWKGMTDYFSGSADLDTILPEIDKAWPAGTTGSTSTGGTTSTASAGGSAEAATAAGLTALADAYGGSLKGKSVTMTGPFTDEDAVKFASSVKAFEDATGIDIQYEGSKEFEASIAARIAANDAPDIIDFPQPGFLAGFVKQGKIVDASTLVPEAWLKQNYLQSWLDMATMAGPNGEVQGGVWHRFNGKSLVWYPKKQFDAAGYKVPTTWAELEALQDQIVADGDTPWCIGIESGAATGWPATDWTEDMMLRTTSPENYDKWVRGELKFDSPEVRKAIDTFAKIWQNDKMVNGGRAKIVTTFFGDAPTPMFENPPKCWLHRQGNFITSFFPKEAVAGVDYDVFYLPGIDEAQGKPFLVAGDLMAATNDRPETAAVMQFFSTGEGVKGWLAAGGALAPQKDASLDWYGVPLERSIAEIANSATTVRFDASDLMPGAVGAGSFWKGMTDYFSGSADLDTILPEIDKAWPAGQ